MLISIAILSVVFIIIIILIALEKINRAVLALFGALITYFVVIFIEKADFIIIADWLIGSASENYGNLRTLVLILSMMIIVDISNEGGLFQFIAFKLIQLTRGKPIPLLLMFDTLSVILSALLSNILTVIILIPLTITVARILNVNPSPFILTEAVLVNVGGTFFTISSIPNIMIASYANIPFLDYFLHVGLISIGIFFITLAFFWLIFRKKIENPRHGIDILLEFNVWNFVSNSGLMKKSAIIFICTILGFMIIPNTILPLDIVALLGAIILMLICKLELKETLKKIDTDLFLYLMGIFILTGGMEYVGIIDFIGNFFTSYTQGDFFNSLILILWGSAYLSATIDNIPITRLLLPVTKIITEGMTFQDTRLLNYGLSIGANWGDNLTPLGDNILVMNISEQNKSPIRMKDFFVLGFVTTNLQLYLVTIFYSFIYQPIIGIVLILCFILFLFLIFGLYPFLKKKRMNIMMKNAIR